MSEWKPKTISYASEDFIKDLAPVSEPETKAVDGYYDICIFCMGTGCDGIEDCVYCDGTGSVYVEGE
jgi:hypothetical protein